MIKQLMKLGLMGTVLKLNCSRYNFKPKNVQHEDTAQDDNSRRAVYFLQDD